MLTNLILPASMKSGQLDVKELNIQNIKAWTNFFLDKQRIDHFWPSVA